MAAVVADFGVIKDLFAALGAGLGDVAETLDVVGARKVVELVSLTGSPAGSGNNVAGAARRAQTAGTAVGGRFRISGRAGHAEC